MTMTDVSEIRGDIPTTITPKTRGAGTTTDMAPVAAATDRYTVALPRSGRTVTVRQIDGDTATVVESLMVDAGFKGSTAMLRCIAAASIVSIDGSQESPPQTVGELKAALMALHRVDWEAVMLRVAALDGMVEDPALVADFRGAADAAAS